MLKLPGQVTTPAPAGGLLGRGRARSLRPKKKRPRPPTPKSERNGKKTRRKRKARPNLAWSCVLPLVYLADPKMQVLLEFSVQLNS